jgi:hypothetical protein
MGYQRTTDHIHDVPTPPLSPHTLLVWYSKPVYINGPAASGSRVCNRLLWECAQSQAAGSVVTRQLHMQTNTRAVMPVPGKTMGAWKLHLQLQAECSIRRARAADDKQTTARPADSMYPCPGAISLHTSWVPRAQRTRHLHPCLLCGPVL